LESPELADSAAAQIPILLVEDDGAFARLIVKMLGCRDCGD
jgi:hypothetical protein